MELCSSKQASRINWRSLELLGLLLGRQFDIPKWRNSLQYILGHWDQWNVASNTEFYIYSLFLHWETDISSSCHSWRTQTEYTKESSDSSYSSPSAILPKISSIQEDLFPKSTSLFGLRTALVKSRRMNRPLLPEEIFLYLERQFLNSMLPKMLYSIKTGNGYYRSQGCCLFPFFWLSNQVISNSCNNQENFAQGRILVLQCCY